MGLDRDSLIRPILSATLTMMAACGSSDPSEVDAASDSDAPPGADAAADAMPVECSALPALPVTSRKLSHVPATEDFTFDTEGYLVGISGDLMRTPYDGQPQVMVTGVAGWTRGTRYLPSGELLVADAENSRLLKVHANGSVEPFAQVPDPNGIIVGRDGKIYVSTSTAGVKRIDPETGASETIAAFPGRSLDGIVFSPDESVLYTDEEAGVIHQIPMNDGVPGTPTELASTQAVMADILDGMTMDVCGNLYVVQMSGVVWRVTPSGQMEKAVDLLDSTMPPFIPAVNFGSGLGGWKRDALYVMDFAGGVFEAELGVPGRLEPHLEP